MLGCAGTDSGDEATVVESDDVSETASLPRRLFECGDRTYYGPDADGDGYPDASESIVPSDCIILGSNPNDHPDCDDSDPNVFHVGFVDSDGDGFGDPKFSQCFSGEEPPVGLTKDFSDCDDSDPSFHPHAADFPGDGLDQNCDVIDGAVSREDWKSGEHFETEDSEQCLDLSSPQIFDFQWSHLVCDLWPSPARAYVSFRNNSEQETIATVARLHSDWEPDWSLELPIPALQLGETTPIYALGEVPPRVTISFPKVHGDACTAAAVTKSALTVCTVP